MKTKLMLAVALVCVFHGVTVRAESAPELTRYVESEIDRLDAAVNESTTSGVSSGPAQEEAYFLRAFMLRVRASGGVNIPAIGKFLVVPELELVWAQAFPEGWSAYKPPKAY